MKNYLTKFMTTALLVSSSSFLLSSITWSMEDTKKSTVEEISGPVTRFFDSNLHNCNDKISTDEDAVNAANEIVKMGETNLEEARNQIQIASKEFRNIYDYSQGAGPETFFTYIAREFAALNSEILNDKYATKKNIEKIQKKARDNFESAIEVLLDFVRDKNIYLLQKLNTDQIKDFVIYIIFHGTPSILDRLVDHLSQHMPNFPVLFVNWVSHKEVEDKQNIIDRLISLQKVVQSLHFGAQLDVVIRHFWNFSRNPINIATSFSESSSPNSTSLPLTPRPQIPSSSTQLPTYFGSSPSL